MEDNPFGFEDDVSAFDPFANSPKPTPSRFVNTSSDLFEAIAKNNKKNNILQGEPGDRGSDLIIDTGDDFFAFLAKHNAENNNDNTSNSNAISQGNTASVPINTSNNSGAASSTVIDIDLRDINSTNVIINEHNFTSTTTSAPSTTASATTTTTASTTPQGNGLTDSMNEALNESIMESIICEVSQILPDIPLHIVKKAVIQSNNNMEQALQIILDGSVAEDEAPLYEPSFGASNKEKGKGKGKEKVQEGGGMTEEEQIMWMLQQEEKQIEMQRKKEEEASLALIMQMQELEVSEKKKREDEEASFARYIADEHAKLEQQRRHEEEVATKLLEELLAEERQARQAQLDAKTYTCSICYTDVKIEDMYTLEECDHRFCFDCMDNFLSTQIKDGTTSIKCPTPTCKHMITFHEVKQVVDDAVFHKYEDFLLRNYLTTDTNCRWCPRPGCGTAMIGSEDNPMLVCPNRSCNFAFCFKCRDEWHHDASCDEYQQWKAMVETLANEPPEEPEQPAKPTKPTGKNPPLPPPPSVKTLSRRQQRILAKNPAMKKTFVQKLGSLLGGNSSNKPPATTTAQPNPPQPTDDKQPQQSPPKAKPPVVVNWQEKLAEKPENLTFREWILSQISEGKSGVKLVKDWIKANTKLCPKCNSPIEKNGGCNHMTCAFCKHQFCWLCSETYTSNHWSTSTCKQYS